MRRVTVTLVNRPDGTQEFDVFDAETGERVGDAGNNLNLKAQAYVKGWIVLNPPKQRRRRKGRDE